MLQCFTLKNNSSRYDNKWGGQKLSPLFFCITFVANDNALVNLYRFVLFRIFVVDCIILLFYFIKNLLKSNNLCCVNCFNFIILHVFSELQVI